LRILFTCRAYVGHLLPMVPLAQALVAAGHDVACSSGPGIRAEVESRGLTFLPAGPDQMTPQQRATLFPEISSLKEQETRAFFFGRVFTAYELPLRAPDLAGVVDSWKPDVLVHEVAEFAGPLVASSKGIPYATHAFGPVPADEVIAAAAAGARPHWEAAGLQPHPRAGLWRHLYLDICPTSMQRGAPAGAPAVRQVRPAERTAARRPRSKPMVYVTLGTVYNTEVGVFRTILEGLEDQPVEVLVTVGAKGDPAALGPRSANVRVERFLPQAEVLPECAAVVTHGGAGTTLGALAFGCPLLLVPQGADQFVNAERVAALGAGLRLLPRDLSASAVRESVGRLLREPSFAAAARRLSDEIAAMPGAGAAVTAIEHLAAERRTNRRGQKGPPQRPLLERP